MDFGNRGIAFLLRFGGYTVPDGKEEQYESSNLAGTEKLSEKPAFLGRASGGACGDIPESGTVSWNSLFFRRGTFPKTRRRRYRCGYYGRVHSGGGRKAPQTLGRGSRPVPGAGFWHVGRGSGGDHGKNQGHGVRGGLCLAGRELPLLRSRIYLRGYGLVFRYSRRMQRVY